MTEDSPSSKPSRLQRLRAWHSSLTLGAKIALWATVFILFAPTIIGTPLSILFAEDIVVFRPLFDVNWWKPKWHWLYWLFYSTPALWVYPLFAIGFLVAGYRVSEVANARQSRALKYCAYAIFAIAVYTVFLWFYAGYASGWYANETLAAQHGPQVQNGSGIPQMDPQDPRIATRDYAKTLAQSQFTDNTLKVGSSDDVTFRETATASGTVNKANWVYPRQPATTPKKYFGHQEGFVTVPMDTREASGGGSDVTECTMKYGFGVSVTDNFRWQLYHNRPYNQRIDSAFNMKTDGECYIVAPKMGRTWHIDWFTPVKQLGGIQVPAPMVYTTPTFKGVDILNEEGDITHVEPSEVATHKVTDNQNVIPTSYARTIVMSLKWHQNGHWRIAWQNIDDYELADTEGDSNSQPFLIKTPSGELTYLFAMEPSGKNSNGVYRIYTMDAQTADVTKHNVTAKSDTLTGPGRAAGYVEQLRPAWFKGERTYKKSEPLPVMRNNTLYWMYRITSPSGDGGIAGVAFVSAEDPENDARLFDDNEATKAVAFMQGKNPDAATDISSKSNTTMRKSDDGQTILIMEDTNDDGKPDTVTRTINVSDEQFVVVTDKVANSTNERANETG